MILMEKSKKMNVLFKIAFILLCICIPLLIAGIVVAYLFGRVNFSAVFTGSGCLLCFAGIILAMLSKPKKPKQKQPKFDETAEEKAEKISIDTEENL